MCSGGGLQSNRIHAGNFEQAVTERLDDAQRALGNLFRLVRMTIGQSFQACHHFIYARVVLHRARAQGIHAQVDRIVPGGEPREVADDFDFTHLGHLAKVLAFRGSEQFCGVDLRHIEWWQFPGSLAGR